VTIWLQEALTLGYNFRPLRCLSFDFRRTGGLMVSVPGSIAIDRGFEPRSGQTIDYISNWYLLLLR
jgi:hypothetical protein